MWKCFAVNKIKSDFHFSQQAMMYNQVGHAKQDIILAGDIALVTLYGGAIGERLDVLRYRRSCEDLKKRIACGTK